MFLSNKRGDFFFLTSQALFLALHVPEQWDHWVILESFILIFKPLSHFKRGPLALIIQLFGQDWDLEVPPLDGWGPVLPSLVGRIEWLDAVVYFGAWGNMQMKTKTLHKFSHFLFWINYLLLENKVKSRGWRSLISFVINQKVLYPH